MTDPIPQATDEQIREVLDAMDVQFKMGQVPPGLPAPSKPLGRVARIFHRRGMWSLSAGMLAQSADDSAQAKASDDSAPPQP